MKFRAFPKDQSVVLTDDNEVKEVLLGLGIIDQLQNPADFGRRAGMFVYDNHPTHWILAVRYAGYAKREDNGYSLHAIPKSKIGREVYPILLKQLKLDGEAPEFMGGDREPPRN